jgi:hypothetical protein
MTATGSPVTQQSILTVELEDELEEDVVALASPTARWRTEKAGRK